MILPAKKGTEKLIRPVMPELDSLRGIAILLVLFFHGFNVEGGLTHLTGPARIFATISYAGWTGVYLFFVVPGFLITGILLDSENKPDCYRRVYIRRALRILPAFYRLLLLLWLLPRTGLFEGRHVGWPFLCCPVLRGIAFQRNWLSNGGYTWLVADALAIGALLGVLARGPLAERNATLRFSLFCLLAAAALLGFGAPLGIRREITLFGAIFRRIAVNVFFTGMLAVTLLLGSSRWKWIVDRPLLRWFGKISYDSI